MFDKHDVTTKKFDAIVEKAGKVDANYAAQIEGKQRSDNIGCALGYQFRV